MRKFQIIFYITVILFCYQNNYTMSKSNALKSLVVAGLGYLGFKGYQKWQEFNRDFTDQELTDNLKLFRNNLINHLKQKISIMRKSVINADKILPKIMSLERDIQDIEHYLHDIESKKIKTPIVKVGYKLCKTAISLSSSIKDIESLIKEEILLKELEVFEKSHKGQRELFRISY